MGWRTILILCLMVAGIAAGLYFTEHVPTEDDGLSQRVLDGRRVFDASWISIRTDPELPALEFGRAPDGGFAMREPIADLASQAMFESIARIWDGAYMRRRNLAAELDAELIEQYELEPPRGEFKIEWPDGKRIELAFGGEGAYGREVFLRRDGDVYVTEAGLLSCLQVGADQYRDPYVFRNTLADVRVMRLERLRTDGTSETLTFRRDGSQLAVDEAGEMLLSQGVVRATVEQILSMRVERFARGGANEIGGTAATYRIDVDGARGREQLDLFATDANTVVGWLRQQQREIVFAVNPQAYGDALTRPLQQLRSLWLFPIDQVQELRTITIGIPGERPLTLDRKRRSLELVAPVEMPCNDSAAAELITALGRFVVQRFEPESMDLAAAGLDADYIVLRLRDPLATRDTEIHIGKRGEHLTYVKRADLPFVVSIANDAVDPVRRPWVDYASLDVLRIAIPGSVQAIEVARGDAIARFSRDEDGSWLDADGKPSDAVDEMYDRVRDLIGTRAVERSKLANLSDPIEFRLQRVGGARAIELELFDTDGRILVGRRDAPVLYELRPGDTSSLLALVPSR
ncbi:MAG: DUF4340 domain-containing protein [Planctomycetes bacterium]|nr:DUF4340 domain-containing protein [Planctomycetota bacterium]